MGVARVNQKLPVLADKMPIDPTTLSVNLKKHGSMNSADVGKKVHFHGHGIVEAINKNEYGHTMRINVKHLKNKMPDTDMDNG